MENLEIKDVSIKEVISAAKLIWENMEKSNFLPDNMINNEEIRKHFINEIITDYLDRELYLVEASINGKVVGVVGSRKNYIMFLFVNNEYQKQGIGTKLMHYMLINLKRNYGTNIEVDATNIAFKFYKNIGFVANRKLKGENDLHPMIYKLGRDKNGISK
jgi:ribosomal protein S18 acetylase RimI-like enzyme